MWKGQVRTNIPGLHKASRLLWRRTGRTKGFKLSFRSREAAAGQVKKARGACGVGLSGKNYRDGQFSFLLDPTTSVGALTVEVNSFHCIFYGLEVFRWYLKIGLGWKLGLKRSGPEVLGLKLPSYESSLCSTRTQPVLDRPHQNTYTWQDRESILFSGHFVLILYWSFSYQQQFRFSKLIIALKNPVYQQKDSPQLQIELKSLCCTRVSKEEACVLAQAKA